STQIKLRGKDMSIVDPATVRYCLAQGMTQTELAREYGVTRQYIHKLAKQAGQTGWPRAVEDDCYRKLSVGNQPRVPL
ncbi:helix-turn-helix domain-containing protein, partial [Corynebacterium pseudodiphtheriticum]|uniref:helix-turn-helix domain-containing protein n=1 Tax=Corynebacterium pseudodiphtheriticum TaxID=37637 RepID=UPI00234CAFBD